MIQDTIKIVKNKIKLPIVKCFYIKSFEVLSSSLGLKMTIICNQPSLQQQCHD